MWVWGLGVAGLLRIAELWAGYRSGRVGLDTYTRGRSERTFVRNRTILKGPAGDWGLLGRQGRKKVMKKRMVWVVLMVLEGWYLGR